MNTKTASITRFSTPAIRYLIMAILVALLAMFVTTTQASMSRTRAKAQAEAQVTPENKPADTQAAEQDLSAWDIIQMTSWLFWPFVALTATGLMLLTLKALQEYQQRTRARALIGSKIGVRELKGLIRGIQDAKPSRASKLMYGIIATFNKTNRAEPIGDDISGYLNMERESFETFNRVMGFLSDTAGALGLLGTVWGIFETFHGGKLDGPTILQGMSVSLVTTLVGLIISLALNAGTTAIFSFFNKQLNRLATRSEELRQALLFLEHKQQNRNEGVRTVNNAPTYSRRMRAEVENSMRPVDDVFEPKRVPLNQDESSWL